MFIKTSLQEFLQHPYNKLMKLLTTPVCELIFFFYKKTQFCIDSVLITEHKFLLFHCTLSSCSMLLLRYTYSHFSKFHAICVLDVLIH